MSRPKKDSKPLNCLLSSDIWNRLNTYCKEVGSNKTFVTEKALEEYLDKCDRQKKIVEKYDK